MKSKTFNFDFCDLNLDVAYIEHVIGYNDGDDRSIVSGLIEEILNESKEICSIKAQYELFSDVRFINGDRSVEIDNISFHVKEVVFSQIKKSESVAIFLCTAGPEIGIRSRKAMQERDLLKGYIYDVVGSVIVEAAADIMQSSLEISMMDQGNRITNRYSPGYCGWDVADQHNLFRLLPENYCGIRLTRSALMDPLKSVSGIIGVGRNVKQNPYTCNMCDMKDCHYRKTRVSKL